VLSKIS